MKVTKEIAIPAGDHEGIITQCHETTKTFDGAKGPEPVVEFVIQPKFAKEGYATRPVSITFSASGSTLGGFAACMAAIGHPIDNKEEVTAQDLADVEGTVVLFKTSTKNDFVNVDKKSIRRKK